MLAIIRTRLYGTTTLALPILLLVDLEWTFFSENFTNVIFSFFFFQFFNFFNIYIIFSVFIFLFIFFKNS